MNNLFDILFEKAVHQPPLFDNINLFCIDNNLNIRIKQNTNYDLSGFWVSLDTNAINHTLKQHGNENVEKLRGQIVVVKNDFSLIEKVVIEADNICLAGKSSIGNDLIIFEKNIEQITYFMVFEIRKIVISKKQKYKLNRLALQTLYKRKTPL